ncbi:peptidoglycan-associated lipoprotein Pal [Candidatus Endoriftia persephonae]|jgi:peptidoglycan-associated lipoprotein|uniref:Peptidoglycan-associated lipoprotein n=2 Tax=Gammaproteobacteria TaxID=1236 RepID=G2FIM8_9GAMM|nr:peptidoglycan-associated lipoprotein Pal [Candidatus Endoriftia persephone]EGW53340.1 peptidoglycan-associated lipoprotein [endosymbiont of Tevnia jerichonana (vent Tica)]USF86517.1 peptidoglycan-associated lipoprotein Pal [Candidatus Endoriftia persephone]
MRSDLIKWAFSVLALVLVAGCSSTPEKDESASAGAEVSEQSTGAGRASYGGASTAAASQGMAWNGDPLDNPQSLLSTRVIYFDFDQSQVRSEFRDVLSAHADYLASHPQVSLRLEGHADERGTREYNLGLGEHRANAVRQLLMAEGVDTNQLIVISYGEERPASFANNEEAWALNRRVELVY